MTTATVLPKFWYALERPALREITRDGGVYRIENLDEPFATPMAAYDRIVSDGERPHFTREVFAPFLEAEDREAPEELEDDTLPLFLSVPLPRVEGEEQMYQAFFSDEADRDLRDANAAYAEFLAAQEIYLANPEDFFASYQFIQQHPYFWHTYGNERVYGWAYALDPDDLHLSVYRDEDGEVYYLIETGPYVDRGPEHSLDPKLIVSRTSYEAAIIEVAKRLHANVDELGEDR